MLSRYQSIFDRHTEPGSKTKVTNTITESCLNAQKSVSSSIPVYFHLQGCWHLTNSKLQFTSHNSAQNCLSLRQGALCVYLFFFNVISIVVILHNPHLLHHLCCPAVHSSSRNLDYPLLNPSPDRPGTIDLLNHKGHDTRVRNSEYRACEPRRLLLE